MPVQLPPFLANSLSWLRQTPAQPAPQAPQSAPQPAPAQNPGSAAQAAQVMPYAQMYGTDFLPMRNPVVAPRPVIPAAPQSGDPSTRKVKLAGPSPDTEVQPGQPSTELAASLTTGGGKGTTGALTETTTTRDEQGNSTTNTDSLSASYKGGKVTVSDTTTDSRTNTDGSGYSNEDTHSTAIGKDGITVSDSQTAATTDSDGTTATQQGTQGMTVGANGVTVTQEQSSSTQNADGTGSSQGQNNSVGYNSEHGSMVLSQGNSSSQTVLGPDGQPLTEKSESSVNAEIGPNNYGGGYSNKTTDANGSVNGSSASVAIDTQAGTVNAGGTVTRDGTTVGGDVTIGQNQVGANVSLKRGDFAIGGGFKITAGEVTTGEHSDGAAASMLGQDYVSTQQRNQVDLSASASFRGIGVSGSMTSGNTIEALAAANMLPTGWDQMTEDQKRTFREQQEQRLATYQDGVSIEELLLLQSGQGVRTTSYNGWSVGGSVPIGGVASLSMGGGQTSAHEVTIVRGPRDTVDANGQPVQSDRIVVNIASMQGSSSELGAGLMGVGLNFGGTNNNSHQYQIEIDPAALQMDASGKPVNQEAYQAVQMMLNTGLMPGAANLTGEGMPERYQEFQSAYSQVGNLTSQIDAQRALLESPDLDPMEAQRIRQQMTQMYGQLDAAQQTIETNRTLLNQSWEQTYSPENQPPIDGILIRSETSAQQQGNTLNVGGTQIASSQQTWTQSQYLTQQNRLEHSFTYNEQNYFLGNLTEAFTGSANTGVDTNAPLFAMYSDNNVMLEENADIIRNIRNRDVPDYVLNDEHWRWNMRGRAEVAMNAQQFNTMTAAMNDMSNPQSQQMWQDMGTRVTQFVSGEQYWLDSGADEHMDGLRGREMNNSRYGWLNDQMNMQPGADGKLPPAAQALQDMGATTEEAMQQATTLFASVNSPQAFQALTPEQQQLFIALLDQTSGRDADVTGQRSSFEALGPISLIEDPIARANTLTTFMADANDEAQMDNRDGALEFIHFTERFRDNKAVYDTIQNAVSFDWTQENAERIAQQDPAAVDKELADAYNTTTYWLFQGDVHDPNEGRALDALMAANLQGGPDRVRAAVLASGADVVTLMNAFPEGSIERQLYMDLINQVPEFKDQLTAATTCS
ncbi:MAG: hypothetical protein U1A78_39585 [Polyangia bacterium]